MNFWGEKQILIYKVIPENQRKVATTVADKAKVNCNGV